MKAMITKNVVLFNQNREIGYNSTWTGLTRIALYELGTVCKSAGDLKKFGHGLKTFLGCGSLGDHSLLELLLEPFPKMPQNAVDNKKCDLIVKHLKQHASETFTIQIPTIKEILHELLDTYAEDCDIENAATDVLVKLSERSLIWDMDDTRLKVIYSLIGEREANLNALSESKFERLLICLDRILLNLCSISSTPATKIFLDFQLDSTKMAFLWNYILRKLPTLIANNGDTDTLRSFVENGFETKDALFLDDASQWNYARATFNDYFAALDLFMDNGARLNPLPGSGEESFLAKLLQLHECYVDNCKISFFDFIKRCIGRGVDPSLPGLEDEKHADLLMRVCCHYRERDLSELGCGIDKTFYANYRLKAWSRLPSFDTGTPSPSKFSLDEKAVQGFNKAVLVLLQRGFQPDCLDGNGSNLMEF